MIAHERDLIRQLLEQERARVQPQVIPPPERETLHYSELPEDTSNGPIAQEWNFYRGEVSRLLADGHEGKWLLIKGEEIMGIYDTEPEADEIRVQRFPMRPVLLKQILVQKPVLRGGGHNRR